MPTTPPPGSHAHRLRVRYAETDQMGRVHHAAYVVYLEDARTHAMESVGCSYAELERSGIGLVVRSLDVRYRAAAVYGDEVVVHTWVRALRGASVTLAYEVTRADGQSLASGSTQLACVDLRATPPEVRHLPDAVREAFERWQA